MVANTSPVHSCTERSANSLRLVVHPDQGVAAGHPHRRAAVGSTTPGRTRSSRRGRPSAGRPSGAVSVSGSSSTTSFSPMRVSPPFMFGEAIGPPHTVVRAVGRIAPQRVVVAEGLGHVPERIGPWFEIPRRLRMGHGDADAGPQRRDALVGQASSFARSAQSSQSVRSSRDGWRPVSHRVQWRIDEQDPMPAGDDVAGPGPPGHERFVVRSGPFGRSPFAATSGSPRAAVLRRRRPSRW